jgi:hypothetical protein
MVATSLLIFPQITAKSDSSNRPQLDNLCAIIDVNRLGQSDPTPLQHDMNAYK